MIGTKMFSNMSLYMFAHPRPKTTFKSSQIYTTARNRSTGHHVRSHSSSQNSFDFEAYMLEKMNSVNKALEETIPVDVPLKLYESMRYTLLAPGKRTRPVLCIAACELVGGKESNAMHAACSLEMIHAAYLMLDDLPCLDNDDLRRARPTNHKVFGENVTVLASAGLLAQSFQHLTNMHRQNNLPPQVLVELVHELSKCAGPEGIAGGEYDDMSSEGITGVGLDHVESIHLRKSVVMPEAAVVMGGLLGGGDEFQIAKLRRFARCIGLMFAIMDDVYDVTKSTQELGKTAGKDLVADKATYPKLLGLKRSKELALEFNKEALEQLHVGFDTQRTAPLIALANYFFGGR